MTPRTPPEPAAESQDDVIAAALAAGATFARAGLVAGVSEKTVSRRMKDPAFKARVAAVRRALLDRVLESVAASAGQVVADALARLRAVAADPQAPAAARVEADRAVLLAVAVLRDRPPLDPEDDEDEEDDE